MSSNLSSNSGRESDGNKTRSVSKGPSPRDEDIELQVEDVQVVSGGEISSATLILRNHFIVLEQVASPKRQSWIPYPILAHCTFRPTPPGYAQRSSLRLRGRDFVFIRLNIADALDARKVFDLIKAKACKVGSIEKLYAFSYPKDAPKPEREINGWEVYNPAREWKRQGISEKGVDKGWRISKINQHYLFSPTYPALLPVPSIISDSTLS